MRKNKEFQSLAGVNQAMHWVLYSIIKDELEPFLKEELQKEIQTRVYDTYTPTVYRRRGERGGLLDKSLMHSEMPYNDIINGEMLRVITQVVREAIGDGKGGTELLAPLIQEKDGYAGNPATGKPRRPYLMYLEESMTRNPAGISRILQRGFKNRGIQVQVRAW